ncbi:MAG TPA: TMEM175 family protein, partial [Thermoleophilia bacterium]|nr:TMEM175 family protein [Thermoleophilia bacterium]
MGKSRLVAFSDGVFAIIITISVLELRPPAGTSWSALWSEKALFLTYVLSFVYLAIYWNNHHHMLAMTDRVSGGILWANMNLLFWLSLFPFGTGWMGHNPRAAPPVAVYGAILLLAAMAYFVLQGRIIAGQGPGSVLAAAVGRDLKGKLSPVAYAVGIGLAFVEPLVSIGIYTGVALVWLVPDRRIERTVAQREEAGQRPD